MVEVSGGAAERVREVVDQLRERKFPYVCRSRRRIPWRLYDLAQRPGFLEILDLVQGSWTGGPGSGPRGPPPLPTRRGTGPRSLFSTD